MKRELPVIILAVAAVLIIAAVALLYDPSAKGSYELTVLFTGDIHGNTQNLPKYYTLVQQIRKTGANVLLLDCGDLYYGGPNQERGGLIEIAMLDYMKYDAMALGNNEFKIAANTAEACNAQLSTLAANASFPLLCANITYKNDSFLSGIKPYTIINKNGLKIGIIGVCTHEISNKEVKDKTLYDGADVFNRLSVALQGQTDIVLALSHCETEANRRMTGAAAIIAGHVHQPTETPEAADDGTPIVRAGGEDKGHLGKLTLKLVQAGGKWNVESYQFELCDLTGVVGSNKLENMRNLLN